ncbi:MAG TPA: hypothetical protein PLY87_17335, partial [Planctomycetaceae bacterium]|nr:hypothetical protein [Planctomycetaceae bacterium]
RSGACEFRLKAGLQTSNMSLFRGSCLGTHCPARLSLEAGASSALRSRAGALEREFTASWRYTSRGQK